MKNTFSDEASVFTVRRLRLAVLCLAACLLLSGCGAARTDRAYSPALTGVQTRGGCSGGEDQQFIKAELTFSQDIRIAAHTARNLRVTIGGERVAEQDIQLEQTGAKALEITIPVQKVTSGILKIEPLHSDKGCGITDKSGKYDASPFQIDTIVPSGAAFGDIRSEESKVTATVLSPVSHRSIVWIRITADGVPLQPDAAGSDVLDQAFAVHEHDFLWATEESTAGDIAEAVNRYFPGRLSAEASGSTVTIRSVSETVHGLLNIEIYTY